MEDVWSRTNKIKCKRCGCYNPIEKSIGSQADDGKVEWFADFYTCSYCGHRGRRLIRLAAKIRDDGEQRPCDNAGVEVWGQIFILDP
jgi:DNA-directed RNA polymerase subunit RPC12/RpoP